MLRGKSLSLYKIAGKATWAGEGPGATDRPSCTYIVAISRSEIAKDSVSLSRGDEVDREEQEQR